MSTTTPAARSASPAAIAYSRAGSGRSLAAHHSAARRVSSTARPGSLRSSWLRSSSRNSRWSRYHCRRRSRGVVRRLGPGQGLEQVGRAGGGQHGVAEGAGHAVQHRAAGQERDQPLREAGQQLELQVVDHEPVVPGQGDRLGGAPARRHRRRGPRSAGPPASPRSAAPARPRRPGRVDVAELEQGAGLAVVHGQVLGADLHHPPLGAQAGQRQGRLAPAGDGQLRPLREVVDQPGHGVQAVQVLQQVDVVEHDARPAARPLDRADPSRGRTASTAAAPRASTASSRSPVDRLDPVEGGGEVPEQDGRVVVAPVDRSAIRTPAGRARPTGPAGSSCRSPAGRGWPPPGCGWRRPGGRGGRPAPPGRGSRAGDAAWARASGRTGWSSLPPHFRRWHQSNHAASAGGRHHPDGVIRRGPGGRSPARSSLEAADRTRALPTSGAMAPKTPMILATGSPGSAGGAQVGASRRPGRRRSRPGRPAGPAGRSPGRARSAPGLPVCIWASDSRTDAWPAASARRRSSGVGSGSMPMGQWNPAWPGTHRPEGMNASVRAGPARSPHHPRWMKTAVKGCRVGPGPRRGGRCRGRGCW